MFVGAAARGHVVPLVGGILAIVAGVVNLASRWYRLRRTGTMPAPQFGPVNRLFSPGALVGIDTVMSAVAVIVGIVLVAENA
jgi:uncharacterized membrane protein HdeD (DUF308 family)